MGTYTCNAEEIADAMESSDLQSNIEGDFYEQDFIKGAKIYIERLREEGAYIFEDGGKYNCTECGRIVKKDGICSKCKEKKKDDDKGDEWDEDMNLPEPDDIGCK